MKAFTIEYNDFGFCTVVADNMINAIRVFQDKYPSEETYYIKQVKVQFGEALVQIK